MANAEIVRDGSKKVRDVCQDFMTREDEALAQRLQDEEFETHYIRNRQERGTARVDTKAAKTAYLEEVKRAGLLREVELQRLAEDDAWLAAELQQRIDEEERLENQHKTANEMQDEEYAQLLQQREKEKLKRERQKRLQKRIERERRELEKIEREQHQGREIEEKPRQDYGFPHSGSRREKPIEELPPNPQGLRVSIPKDNENWSDLRSHEADDTVTAEEGRNRHQEHEDEEFARQLQRQEQEKLRKLMEERDRRLALKMQRREAEEYRRERAERQSRKASTREQRGEGVGAEGQASEVPRDDRPPKESHSNHTRHEPRHCDPSQHYYEKPVYNTQSTEFEHVDREHRAARSDERSNLERRQNSGLVESRSKNGGHIYEELVPENHSQWSENVPQKVDPYSHRDAQRLESDLRPTESQPQTSSQRRDSPPQRSSQHQSQHMGMSSQPQMQHRDSPPLRKSEQIRNIAQQKESQNNRQIKGSTAQSTSRMYENASQQSHHDQYDSSDSTGSNGNQKFFNVAASIDPTFKGEVEEKPKDEDRVWAIGDSGIRVSSSSKPAPLIQNTKRKTSKDKGGKDKDKCKQQ